MRLMTTGSIDGDWSIW